MWGWESPVAGIYSFSEQAGRIDAAWNLKMIKVPAAAALKWDSPREVVGNHGSGYSHLLEGENEFCDPDEAHGVVPHQILRRPLHFIFYHAWNGVLHRRPCVDKQEGG